MEILPKLEWCCVEIPAGQETYRSVLTRTQIKSEIYSDLEIGDNVNVDDKQGTLIASSKMGITIFDLFTEILTKEWLALVLLAIRCSLARCLTCSDSVNCSICTDNDCSDVSSCSERSSVRARRTIFKDDMKRLLEKFDVNETFTGAGLVLRCFLILMDLNKDAWYQDQHIETCAEVKVEALSDEEEIINDNTSIQDFELALGSIEALSDCSADSDEDNLHGFFIPKKSRLDTKPVKRRVKMIGEDGYYVNKQIICNGKGCKCGMSFGSQVELQNHYMEKECFKCKKCDICFPTSRKLRTHSQTMHPRNPKEVKPGIICKIKACGQSFETADALAKHQKEPHYKCDCGEAYHKPNELLRHKREDYCRYLVCERCDINYLDAEPAKRHTYAKDHYRSCSERSFVCDKCGFRTHTANLLKRHQQIHTAERVQKRELSRLNFLARTESQRRNPRNFPCDQCDMSYTTKQRLQFHQLKHAGGPQFQCPYCDLKLMTPGTLQKHIQVRHQNGKPQVKILPKHAKPNNDILAIDERAKTAVTAPRQSQLSIEGNFEPLKSNAGPDLCHL